MGLNLLCPAPGRSRAAGALSIETESRPAVRAWQVCEGGRSSALDPRSKFRLTEENPATLAVKGNLAALDLVADRATRSREKLSRPVSVEEAVIPPFLKQLRHALGDRLDRHVVEDERDPHALDW